MAMRQPRTDPLLHWVFNYTLETNNNVGNYTSIPIGVDGNPIISHLDATNSIWSCGSTTQPATGANQALETIAAVGYSRRCDR